MSGRQMIAHMAVGVMWYSLALVAVTVHFPYSGVFCGVLGFVVGVTSYTITKRYIAA